MQESNIPVEKRAMILTAAIDEMSFLYFDDLRKMHFPAERNFLSAHLTLFHNLPQIERNMIERKLTDLTAKTKAFPMTADGLWMIGRGVAYKIAAPVLNALRLQLAESFSKFLIPQDRHFKAHITVQNKVDFQTAKALNAELEKDFRPLPVTCTGFDLWRYDDGPWTHLRHFTFSG